jgi:hypothetical protein
MEQSTSLTNYSSKGQKVKDLILGFLIYWGSGIVGGGLSYLFMVIATMFASSQSSVDSTIQSILQVSFGLLAYLPSILILVVQIGSFIYFLKKRQYISIGIVAGFVFSIVLSILLVGACFVILANSGI